MPYPYICDAMRAAVWVFLFILAGCSSPTAPPIVAADVPEDTLTAEAIAQGFQPLVFQAEVNRQFQDTLVQLLTQLARVKKKPDAIRESELRKQMMDWQNQFMQRLPLSSPKDRQLLLLLKDEGEKRFEQIRRTRE